MRSGLRGGQVESRCRANRTTPFAMLVPGRSVSATRNLKEIIVMPRFVVDGLENHQIPNTAFQFSGVGIKKLLSARYTVVQLVCDASPSVEDFMADEEACLKRALRACKLGPAKDNALMRTTVFARQVKEIHGFVPLMEVDESGYDNILQGQGGSTALFAATEEGVRAAMTYADSLVDKDYDINGLVIVITDGMNNEPPHGCDRVHDAFQST